MTTTRSDLIAAYSAHCDALERFGLIEPGYRVVIAEGSKTYGNAYRLAKTGIRAADGTYPNGSGHSNPPVGSDYLGMTKAEACDQLITRTRAIYDLAALWDIEPRDTTRDDVEAGR